MKGECKTAHFLEVDVRELGMCLDNDEAIYIKKKNVRKLYNELATGILGPNGTCIGE